MERYDIAVIGTGPAGISAAITAKIRGKNILLLGSRTLSDKITSAERIENYPGLPHISGKELAQKLSAHLSELDISITERRIAAVYAMGSYFGLQSGEDIFEAKSVIVASGVVREKLIEGEEKYLGRGVSYCATCDAMLYKGKHVTVIGSSSDSAEEAEFLSTVVASVNYIPMNDILPAERENIRIIKEKPLAVEGTNKVTGIKTDGGEYETSCVFILRDAVMPDKFIPGVDTDVAHIKVDISMCTNIAGLFACGDIAGTPYQYIKAAGQGNTAALSAVKYLNTLK